MCSMQPDSGISMRASDPFVPLNTRIPLVPCHLSLSLVEAEEQHLHHEIKITMRMMMESLHHPNTDAPVASARK